jgi:hypothetical protein
MESSQSVSKHRELVTSSDYQRGCDFAMLQYTAALANQTNSADTAMVAGLKIRGAHEFLEVMKTLGETIKMPAPVALADLDHRA